MVFSFVASFVKRNNNSASEYNKPSIPIHHELDPLENPKMAGASNLCCIQAKCQSPQNMSKHFYHKSHALKQNNAIS
jgi:hypothetical protein